MLIKKILLSFVLTCFAMSMLSCSNLTQDVSTTDTTVSSTNTLEGRYSLSEESIGGYLKTNSYVYNILELNDDGTLLIHKLDLTGISDETGTYSFANDTISMTIGLRVFDYLYNADSGSLSYSGTINRQLVNITYQKNDIYTLSNTTGNVSLYDELFGESQNDEFYNYAPSVMIEGNNIMHIWYCSNKDSGDITDYIAYRKGTLMDDGLWVFTEKVLVLGPTEGTWDSRHTCDPDVIKGLFHYQNDTYPYLMTYLGCVTSDNSANEVGLAVAKNPEGPWIKVDEINPIANYYTSTEYDAENWAWGYGQPSLISVDKSSKVLLFYTKGLTTGTFEYVEYWDLSDLSNPIKLDEASLLNTGVVNSSSSSDVINNASFAYDPFYQRLYVIKEDFPYPEDGEVNWITGSNTVLYIELSDTDIYTGETLFSSSYRWNVVSAINMNLTSYSRNHNMSFITDEYGWIINPYELPIVYTVAATQDDEVNPNQQAFWQTLGTYRLHGIIIDSN